MVSIVLVTYNRAQRLEKSIRDILNQSFTEFELIICDDCSPDNTQEVCEYFASIDDRIRYFRHDANLRMPENLNFGMRHAQFEYIAILHDGDRFRRDLIQQWYQAISENPNVGFVFNTIATTGENDQIIDTIKYYDEGIVPKEELLQNGFYKKKRFISLVYGETMVRRSLVERYGYLHPEYGFYSDVDLWMEILHTHDAYHCADILYTGESKELMPQQFNTDLVELFMYMYDMHRVHRHKSFRSNRATLFLKMATFNLQSCIYLTYYLLLTVKNFPFSRYMEAPARLNKRWFLLLPWLVILLAYPIAKPLMQIAGKANRQLKASKTQLRSKWKTLQTSESGLILDMLPAGLLLIQEVLLDAF